MIKYSEIVSKMQERNWTQQAFFVKYNKHNKYCVAGYLAHKLGMPIKKMQTLYMDSMSIYNYITNINQGETCELMLINDNANNFQEAKSKSIEYLKGLDQ